MTNDGGLIRVGAEQLDGMADHIRTIHGSMSSGFEALSTDLLNTMADWGRAPRPARPTTASRAVWTAPSPTCSSP